MRRLLAITMSLLFGLTLAAPLFAADAAGALPECCRRNGRHHCSGGMFTDQSSRTISTIAPKCPNCPKATPAAWPNDQAPTRATALSCPLYSHPESAPQTEARYRVAFARSRQKRGPPTLSL
jgi:hypothetical protein